MVHFDTTNPLGSISQIRSAQISGKGRTHCDACRPGHYCPKADEGMIPCPAGTWSRTAKNSVIDHCQHCPVGTFSTVTAATDDNVCHCVFSNSEIERIFLTSTFLTFV